MNEGRWLFEKGCFLGNWNEDIVPVKKERPVESISKLQDKDLNTLLAELEDIKQHIEDVRQRQWHLSKLIEYHNNGFAQT